MILEHPLTTEPTLFPDMLGQVEPRGVNDRSVFWVLRSYSRPSPREGQYDIRVEWSVWEVDTSKPWRVECWHYRYHWREPRAKERGRRLDVSIRTVKRQFATREEAIQRAEKVVAAHDRVFHPAEGVSP